MKRLCLLFFGLVAIAVASAQTSLMATLSHEGNLTSYYGATALAQAYDAAADGDVITLSSGQFVAVDLDKSITIRGAGYETNLETGQLPTIMTGNFRIYDKNISLEGIYHNFLIAFTASHKLPATIQFIKCRLNEFETDTNYSPNNPKFELINCLVTSRFDLYRNSSATIINSIINCPYSNPNYNSVMEFINSYVHLNSKRNPAYSSYTNCFIYCDEGVSIPANCSANYCVGFTADTFKNLPAATNKVVDDTNIFESFAIDPIEGVSYKLTEAAKNTYKGHDGKEVGIYGGAIPYSTVPNNPQITKFNVAEKSTADGKLSIDISVSMPE